MCSEHMLQGYESRAFHDTCGIVMKVLVFLKAYMTETGWVTPQRQPQIHDYKKGKA